MGGSILPDTMDCAEGSNREFRGVEPAERVLAGYRRPYALNGFNEVVTGYSPVPSFARVGGVRYGSGCLGISQRKINHELGPAVC